MCKKTVEEVVELREINLGLWDGLTRQEIDERFPGTRDRRGRDLAGYWPPGGESFAGHAKRVVPACTAIAETALERTIIVTHAGVIRVNIAHILGMPHGNIFRIACDYGRAAVLVTNNGQGYAKISNCA